MSGRPRTTVGTYGSIHVVQVGRGRFTAYTRYRDTDGRLRQVKATSTSHNNAVSKLKNGLLTRPGYGRGGMLSLTSPFGDLADLWLADLALRELSEGTKENYRDDVRVHVRPYHYTLGEITTGRVEAFLKAERVMSYSRAKHSRTMLNLLFGFALRHDAIARNPVEGTSPLRKPKGSPEALTLDQIQRIRHAAAVWRTAAISEIRLDTDGRIYYRRKLAAGKTKLEALRCLKRRISDALYRQLIADAEQAAHDTAPDPVGTGPGGHCGASQESSAVDLPPRIDTADQPLPGPAKPTLQPARKVTKTPSRKKPQTTG